METFLWEAPRRGAMIKIPKASYEGVKYVKKLPILAGLMIALSLLLLPQVAVALPNNPKSMNARFVKWPKLSHVIHIFVYWDDGRPGYPDAEVAVGQPVLFGFEWGGDTLEELWDYIDNEDHNIRVSVDGGEPIYIKDGYQDPFIAETRSGPAWSWDHDGDGPGDKNGNGIGDWSGPVLFFRYQSQGLPSGTHEFLFEITDDGGLNWSGETITVIAG